MKVKASSIIESMIAMIIIGVIISAAITLFVSVRKDSFLQRNQEAYISCSFWFSETLKNKEYVEEKKEYEEFNLLREIQTETGKNWVEVVVRAEDKFGVSIIERRQIVKRE